MGAEGRPLYATFLASTAALGGFLFGFDSAVINGAVSGIQRSFRSSSAGTGFAVASILLGCAVGALAAGRLADRLGRRPVMVATAVIFAATAAASALASGAAVFTLARFISGSAWGRRAWCARRTSPRSRRRRSAAGSPRFSRWGS